MHPAWAGVTLDIPFVFVALSAADLADVVLCLLLRFGGSSELGGRVNVPLLVVLVAFLAVVLGLLDVCAGVVLEFVAEFALKSLGFELLFILLEVFSLNVLHVDSELVSETFLGDVQVPLFCKFKLSTNFLLFSWVISIVISHKVGQELSVEFGLSFLLEANFASFSDDFKGVSLSGLLLLSSLKVKHFSRVSGKEVRSVGVSVYFWERFKKRFPVHF